MHPRVGASARRLITVRRALGATRVEPERYLTRLTNPRAAARQEA